MRFRHHDPDVRLRGAVQSYWELEDLQLSAPEQNADLPERTIRLMFSADRLLIGPSVEALRPLLPVSLSRFSLQPRSMVVQGRLRALVVEFYPWAARQLLGWRAEMVPDALDAALSASAWGREIVALIQLAEWDAAREVLETHLLRLTAGQGEPGTGVQAARQIYQSSGRLRVARLAEELNLSPRTLERQFVQQVGVSAKVLARVVRFDEVNNRIRENPAVPMAELTFELGFFDQAHLIKEFKALSSMTPGAFAVMAAQRSSGLDLSNGGDHFIEVGPLPHADSDI
ncbi:helix-turn-helix domain-containing protein [Deinococcus sp. KNUC1210]|uniref:AraC family transcriptional regulator n=1 Tax=Deinococcus sp. KNUC1210 TaxID=2917691 RepID=UPI001EF0C820|nr:helix-turn-helix domain-containing protein [Deinococcus sp. KNUC1210]ULH16039.1 helix-turn-helix domain-containing protein [Deinococcus sp. KNUC1210]